VKRRSCLNKQTTFYQRITSHVRGLQNSANIVLKYRKAYQNYLSVLWHIIQKKYPSKAILRDGRVIMLNSFEVTYNLARLQNQEKVSYDVTTDTVLIPDPRFTNSKSLRLEGGLHNGEIINIFVHDIYRNFPARGKIVIDVGANIADSSIYFVLHGAKRVISIEPLFKNYGLAERNIKLNNFANRITLILAGCSARSGSADVMISGAEGIGQQISRGLNNRMAVPLLTLEEILQQNNVSREETALKMDCGGCEYDVILSSPDDVLKSFSNILIEYHYGHKEIKEKLEKSNFDISLINISGKQGGPTAVPNPSNLGRWYHMGYIHAKRK
jgi:FkbM family methyltransferase